MKISQTHRGFDIIEFEDRYEAKCSLQKSSLVTEDAIWLGVVKAKPKILASKVMEGGTGWVDYPLPEDVSISTSMHLTREQVKELLPHLELFVNTGEI